MSIKPLYATVHIRQELNGQFIQAKLDRQSHIGKIKEPFDMILWGPKGSEEVFIARSVTSYFSGFLAAGVLTLVIGSLSVGANVGLMVAQVLHRTWAVFNKNHLPFTQKIPMLGKACANIVSRRLTRIEKAIVFGLAISIVSVKGMGAFTWNVCLLPRLARFSWCPIDSDEAKQLGEEKVVALAVHIHHLYRKWNDHIPCHRSILKQLEEKNWLYKKDTFSFYPVIWWCSMGKITDQVKTKPKFEVRKGVTYANYEALQRSYEPK